MCATPEGTKQLQAQKETAKQVTLRNDVEDAQQSFLFVSRVGRRKRTRVMDASRDWSMDEAGHRLCWTTRVPRLDRTFLTTVRVYYMVAENAIRVCTMRARSHFSVNGPRFRGAEICDVARLFNIAVCCVEPF